MGHGDLLIYIDICGFTQFQFPVVVTGMDNQLEKVCIDGVHDKAPNCPVMLIWPLLLNWVYRDDLCIVYL